MTTVSEQPSTTATTNTKPTLIQGSDVVAAANTHICWGPAPNTYTPPEDIAEALLYYGVTLLRERWFPRNKNQQRGFTKFVEGGGRLYLVMGAMDSSREEIADDMATWRASPFVDATFGMSGPNEPNKSGNETWQNNLRNKQQVIFDNRVDGVPVSAGALMFNVDDYDGDLRKLKSAGVVDLCEVGDFHYYPNAKGPLGNEPEVEHAREAAFGDLPLIQSETGWTTHQGWTTEQQSWWVCETVLRSHLRDNMAATIIYEFLDNVGEEGKHSGNFGPDWSMVRDLTKAGDSGRKFPGWLSQWSKNVPYDGQAVATSGPDGWTLYLLATAGSPQTSYTLVLPPGLSCSLGEPTKIGDDGNQRWVDVAITRSMEVVEVSSDD